MQKLDFSFDIAIMMKMHFLESISIEIDPKASLLEVKEEIYKLFWDRIEGKTTQRRHGTPDNVQLYKNFSLKEEITNNELLLNLMAQGVIFHVAFSGHKPASKLLGYGNP